MKKINIEETTDPIAFWREYSEYHSGKWFAELLKGGVNAESKEEYLRWVDDWKKQYATLSEQIRRLKRMRPEYVWTSNGGIRSRVGTNPIHHEAASWVAAVMGNMATDMLTARSDAKIASWSRKKESEKTTA